MVSECNTLIKKSVKMYYNKKERNTAVALPLIRWCFPQFGSQLTLIVVFFITTTAYDLSSDLRFRGSLKKPQLALHCVRPPVSICADKAEDIFRGVLQYFIGMFCSYWSRVILIIR